MPTLSKSECQKQESKGIKVQMKIERKIEFGKKKQ